MATFKLSILSPMGKLFDGDAEFTALPGREGEVGILAHHTPMICSLKRGAGKVIVSKDETQYFAIGEGIVEVCDNQVNVLVDFAERVNSLEDVKHLVI